MCNDHHVLKVFLEGTQRKICFQAPRVTLEKLRTLDSPLAMVQCHIVAQAGLRRGLDYSKAYMTSYSLHIDQSNREIMATRSLSHSAVVSDATTFEPLSGHVLICCRAFVLTRHVFPTFSLFT